jgi:hypothetical protein
MIAPASGDAGGKDDQYSYESYSTFVGAGAGLSSGAGLSYKKWFEKKWALQVNLLPFYYQENFKPGGNNDTYRHNDSGFHDYGLFSLGLAYQRLITRLQDFRILSFVSAAYNGSYDKGDYYYTEERWESAAGDYVDYHGHTVKNDMEHRLAVGGGFGGEIFLWRFSLMAATGICAGYNFSDETVRITPTIEGSIHFMY